MPRNILYLLCATALLVILAVVAAIGMNVAMAQTRPARGGDTMQPLRSDAELRALLRRVRSENAPAADAMAVPMPPPPSPAVAAPAEAAPATDAAARSQPAAPAPGITNVQTAGVDEGGIVKTHGRHLVVLRRGRLFTIDASGEQLRAVDHIDAFPPGDAGSGAWYDEMLVTGDTIIVIGFNYARGGTEINRFRIGGDGRLSYIDTHHLRSNDYYSADNYASRLIGTRLIIYTPLDIWSDGNDALDVLPAIRRWSEGGGSRASYERIAMARDVYLADLLRQSPKARIDTLHSVMSCDLAAPRIRCRATVVPGSYARTFYVGTDAVYVWTGDLFSDNGDRPSGLRDRRGLVYRMPLDGSAPQAAVVWGGPVDQFGLRSEPDGTLHALVRGDYQGDSMWLERSRQTPGALALLALPRSAFGRGSGTPDTRHYRALPPPQGFNLVENRFVGDYLVYGGSNRRRVNDTAFAVALASGDVTPLRVGIAVSRIDRMGGDAILIGSSGNALSFQSVALGGGAAPAIVDRYDLAGSSEGESRSQAFFFRPDNADGTNGVLGLPVARSQARGMGNLLGTSSGIFYMTRTARRLAPAGQLNAGPVRTLDDGCVASCVDWYGNARPIFLGNRIFALMGYELVEGQLDRSRTGGGTIREVQRLDFAPRRPQGR